MAFGDKKTRGKLPNIKLLPRACQGIVAWAAQELQKNDRTQTDIYGEFHSRLTALKAEHRGELEFTIPSFQAFNRYSMSLAAFTNDIAEAKEMSAIVLEHFGADEEDDLTRMATMSIKSLVVNLMVMSKKGEIDPKGAKYLADALRSAAMAEGISTTRRQKINAQFEAGVNEAVDQVAKAKGMTAETVAEIKAQILGIRAD